ncbi:MAG: response regulator, partial [Planctomycetota bacterium]
APDLPIVFANPAFEEMTGYAAEDVVGRNCRMLPGPDTDPKAVAALRAAIDAEQPARAVLLNYRKDGSPFWNEISIAPVRSDDGAVTHFVGSTSDVSSRVETEHLLAQAREAAEAASRSKSHFVAAISHELRTPLGALLGFADVLLNEVADPRVRASVEAMRRNGEHLTSLVNDLLDIAGMEAGRLTLHREPVALLSVLDDVRSLALPKAIEKGLDLRFLFTTRLPETVIADATRLRQIVLNLVGNAVKFTSVGRVHVEVACRAERPPRLRIEVRDTGLGMTAAQQARLFEPFSRVHESAQHSFPGTGLGLSITKHLVERMGGSIEVTSALGVGSTFRVDLPLEVPASAAWLDAESALTTLRQAGVHATQPLPRLPDGCRVLVADDEADIRRYLADLLGQARAEVEVVSDGIQAIDRLLAAHGSDEPFDLVVLDIQMPGRDGVEVLQHVRAAGDYTSAIAISAGAMAEERGRCLEAGFLRFFAKPVDAHRFLESAATIIGRRNRPRSETIRSVLVVEDDPDAARSLALLIERWGCEVRVAESLREAVMLVRSRRPQAIAVDMGLPDGDGATLPALLRDAGIDLDGIELGALTGEAGDAVARRVQAAGFGLHLVKPVDPDRLREFCCP